MASEEKHGWDPYKGECICGWEAKSDKRAKQEVERHAAEKKAQQGYER